MSIRKVAAIASFAAAAFGLFFMYGNFGTSQESFAALAMHGTKTVSSANTILNEYTSLTGNVSAGGKTINVSNSSLNANGRFSSNLQVGELVMIIQMQGVTFTETNDSTYGKITAYNNCGRYEFGEVFSIPSATQIKFVAGLKYSYTSSGKVQVIRVPRYSTLTINSGASVTAPAWNGTTGGIVAVEANNGVTLNGTIDVSGKGFRGGVVEQNSNIPGDHVKWRSASALDGGEKGESVAGYQGSYAAGRYGRGAPANGGGGGNSHNASGGGGANSGVVASWNGKGNPDNSSSNWTTAWNLESPSFSTNVSSGGGRGGYSYSANAANPKTKAPTNSTWGGDNRYNVGGWGGRPLDYSGGRIFFGGGGGAGDSNDGTGTSGAAGGGIVYILSGRNVNGSGSILANGDDAATTTGPQGWDGSGGGGGGGAVLIYTQGQTVSGITINAKGGTGGNQYLVGDPEAEGAGGGGGGGYISTTTASGLTRNVSGGSQGATNSSTMVNFLPNGGTAGGAGTITTGPLNPYSGTVTLPIDLKNFYGKVDGGVIILNWITASEINNEYFTLERSPDGLNYIQLGTVQGAGNSTQEIHYSYPDDGPLEGDNYYRLTQTDFDGKSETFPPIHLEYQMKDTKEPVFKAGPNPFTDRMKIDYETSKDAEVEFQLYSISGQLVKSAKEFSGNGMNSFQWDELGDLPKGTYILILLAGETKSRALQMIKQ
ncbi:MAG TPA: T9SS type A sorting domain-containing protein [Bacteroidia bacterium]|nr:T9SS type A sorting domain-containing protein [Bacteroidia bacterium]